MFIRSAVVASLLLASGARAETATVRTRVPQANVDAFMADCSAKNVARASCWCMVEKFHETNDGQIMFDAMTVAIVRGPNKTSQADMAAFLNRHNLRSSQLQPIRDKMDATVTRIANECD